jgi:hypothetical protein
MSSLLCYATHRQAVSCGLTGPWVLVHRRASFMLFAHSSINSLRKQPDVAKLSLPFCPKIHCYPYFVNVLCPSHHDTLDGDIGSSRDQVAIDEGLIHRLSRPTANAGPDPRRRAGLDGGGPG